MQDTRHIGQALPPGPTHLLPVMDRGGTCRYPGLGLCDLGLVCLGALLHFLQALLGVLEVSFGLPLTPENAKRISLGQVMAQMKQIRDTRATQPRVSQLD